LIALLWSLLFFTFGSKGSRELKTNYYYLYDRSKSGSRTAGWSVRSWTSVPRFCSKTAPPTRLRQPRPLRPVGVEEAVARTVGVARRRPPAFRFRRRRRRPALTIWRQLQITISIHITIINVSINICTARFSRRPPIVTELTVSKHTCTSYIYIRLAEPGRAQRTFLSHPRGRITPSNKPLGKITPLSVPRQ